MLMVILNHELNLNSTANWLNLLLAQPKIAAMNEADNIIKTRLREMEKTQGWLAEKTGVSINAVSKWTKGGRIAPENIVAVAYALGVTADELLKGSQVEGDSSSDLVTLNAIERRILALYNGTSDRGKLDMLSAIEDIARDVEEQRRQSVPDGSR